jgi:hypothetical protein
MSKYYYLFLPQIFLAKNEAFEEIFRERACYYNQKNLPKDFWIVPSPAYFIEEEKIVYPDILSNYSALVSTNKEFILSLKARIGFFYSMENLKKLNKESNGNPLKELKNLKIYGEIDSQNNSNWKILKSLSPKYSTQILFQRFNYMLNIILNYSFHEKIKRFNIKIG